MRIALFLLLTAILSITLPQTIDAAETNEKIKSQREQNNTLNGNQTNPVSDIFSKLRNCPQLSEKRYQDLRQELAESDGTFTSGLLLQVNLPESPSASSENTERETKPTELQPEKDNTRKTACVGVFHFRWTVICCLIDENQNIAAVCDEPAKLGFSVNLSQPTPILTLHKHPHTGPVINISYQLEATETSLRLSHP